MDTSNDDLNVGVSFDADTRPILSALAEIKATLKALDQALPKGQIERALAEPIANAVKSIEGSINSMREGYRRAQGAMVDDARRSGKEMGAAFAGGMEQAAMTVKRQMAQMQAQYEGAVANGWKVNVATLQKLREEGVRLYAEDRRRLLEALKDKTLETEASRRAESIRARLSKEAEAAALKAQKELQTAVIKSASNIDPRTLLGLEPERVVNSAKAAAKVFSEAFKLDEAGARTGGVPLRKLLGLDEAEIKRSARDSAAVFAREFQLDDKGTRAGGLEARKLLGLPDTVIGKAAKEAADVFAKEFRLDEQGGRKGGADARKLLGLPDSALAKAAKDSAAVFAKEFRLDEQGLRGGSVDVRKLLGLPDNAVARAAKDSAAVFAREFRLDEKGMRGGASVDPRVLLGLPSSAELSGFSSALKADLMKQAEAAKAAAGSTKDMSLQAKAAKRAQEELKNTLGLTTKSMNDAHSAARGLASGFNAMWLTWGNIAPLLAGAAVSTSFVQSLKIGAEVGQNLTKIYALGGESAEAVSALNAELLRMSSKGPFGPIEVSNALKTLSLAGLDAKQQIDALQSVLNFAVAGDLPIEKAAETLVAVGTAYGYTAKNFDVVSDLISQAAASSMSSVESMSEAFKQASVIAQQYRVSLQDTALSLSMLAQIGIQGSSAGTAVRNMYTELLGSSQKARKVLQDTLKIDVWDKQANAMKPVVQIMKEMNEALSKFESRDQQKILNALGNERGTKAIAANLAGLRDQWGKTQEEFNNGLAKMQRQLEDAPGFAAIAAVQMAQSTQNQIKSVVSALQTELVKAFQQAEPEVQKLAASMKSLIQSDGFQQAVSTMVGGVASLLNGLVSLVPVLEAAAKAYISLKVAQVAAGAAMIAASVWAGVAKAVGGLTVALQAGVGGLTAIRTVVMSLPVVTAAAAAGFTALQISMGAIGLVLAGLTTAYFLFRKTTNEADQKRKESNSMLDSTLEGLKKEEERLDAVMEARRSGVVEMEIEGKVRAEQIKAEITQSRDLAMAELQVARARLMSQKAKMDPEGFGDRGQWENFTPQVEQAIRGNAKDINELDTAMTRLMADSADKIALVDRVQEKARENARQAREEAEKGRKTPTGPQTFDEGALSKKSRARIERLKTDLGNELSLIKQRYTDEVSTIQQAERNEQELLKQRHEAKLVTDGEFYARELQLAQESETKRLQLIESAGNEWGAKFVSQWESLHQDYARVVDDINGKLKGDDARQALEQAAEAMQQKLTQMAAEAQTFYQALGNDKKTIKDNIFTRTQLQAIKAQGAIRAVQLEMEKFRREQAAASEAANRAEAFEDQIRYASPEQVAYMQAANAEKERFIDLLVEEAEAQRQAELDLAAYLKTAGDMSTWGKEQFQLVEGLMNLIDELKRKRAELEATGEASAEDAGVRAARRYQKDEVARISDDVAGAVVTGLISGGEAGKRQLRNIILRELQKPITMVIRAMVQPIISGIMGGAAGSAAGGAGGSFLGNAGGSIIGNAIGGVGAFGIGASYGMTSLFANGLGATLSAGSSMIGAGSVMSGLGTIAGALGPIVLGVSALASIISSLDDSGTYHTGGAAQYSATGGMSSGQDGSSYNIGFGRVEKGQPTIDAVSSVARGVGTALDSVAKAFGRKAGFEVATAFADDTSKDGAWGALRISQGGKELLNWENDRASKWAPREFADGEEGYKQYLAAVAKDTRKVLLDMDLPSWADKMLNDLGEAPTMEALTAVVNQINITQAAFEELGNNLVGFAKFSDEAKFALVELSGGVEALMANASTYYQNFYSPEEMRANLARQLQGQFDKLNIKMPDFKADDARAQFRALIEAQDSTTEEGRKVIAMLLKLSGAFSELATTGDQIRDSRASLQDRLDKLRGNERAILDRQRKAEFDALYKLDPALAALVTQIYELEDAANAAAEAERKREEAERKREDAIDKAYRNLQRAVDLERRRLEEQIEGLRAQKAVIEQQREAQQQALDLITGVFDLVRENARSLYAEVSSTSALQEAEGRQLILQALNTARATGKLPEQGKLSEAIEAVRSGLNRDKYRSQFELERDTLVLAGQLSELEAISGKQKSLAEQQIALLESQIKGVDDQIELLEDQIKQQQEMLDAFQEQIDIANNVYAATISVADAIAALQAALVKPTTPTTPTTPSPGGSGSGGGAVFGPGGSGTPQPTSPYNRPVYLGTAGTGYSPVTDAAEVDKLNHLASVYHTYDGTGDLTGLLTAIRDAGGTISDLEAMSGYYQSDWRRAAESVGIPAFAVGTNRVPKDMLAQIHKDEAIIPKAFNPWAGGVMPTSGGSSDNARLEALVENLNATVSELRGELVAIKTNTAGTPQMVRQFDQVSGGGSAMRNKAPA